MKYRKRIERLEARQRYYDSQSQSYKSENTRPGSLNK